MYALANNVDRYQEFLPWCNDSQVLDHGEGYAVARIDIRHRGIATSFTTHNRLIADEQILMELLEGPFSVLEGKWDFVVLDHAASRVGLTVDFGFSSRLIEKTIAPVFTQICGDLIDAFAERAGQVYGERRFA